MRGFTRSESIKTSLKTARKQAKMTQEALAVEVGVTRQTIISIETGKYTPSLPLALKLAKVFNTSVEDLFSL